MYGEITLMHSEIPVHETHQEPLRSSAVLALFRKRVGAVISIEVKYNCRSRYMLKSLIPFGFSPCGTGLLPQVVQALGRQPHPEVL